LLFFITWSIILKRFTLIPAALISLSLSFSAHAFDYQSVINKGVQGAVTGAIEGKSGKEILNDTKTTTSQEAQQQVQQQAAEMAKKHLQPIPIRWAQLQLILQRKKPHKKQVAVWRVNWRVTSSKGQVVRHKANSWDSPPLLWLKPLPLPRLPLWQHL
jgi:hypothetical protein